MIRETVNGIASTSSTLLVLHESTIVNTIIYCDSWVWLSNAQGSLVQGRGFSGTLPVHAGVMYEIKSCCRYCIWGSRSRNSAVSCCQWDCLWSVLRGPWGSYSVHGLVCFLAFSSCLAGDLVFSRTSDAGTPRKQGLYVSFRFLLLTFFCPTYKPQWRKNLEESPVLMLLEVPSSSNILFNSHFLQDIIWRNNRVWKKIECKEGCARASRVTRFIRVLLSSSWRDFIATSLAYFWIFFHQLMDLSIDFWKCMLILNFTNHASQKLNRLHQSLLIP